MEKGKLSLHPQAVNIARRYTEMNENDLVMVRYFILCENIHCPWFVRVMHRFQGSTLTKIVAVSMLTGELLW